MPDFFNLFFGMQFSSSGRKSALAQAPYIYYFFYYNFFPFFSLIFNRALQPTAARPPPAPCARSLALSLRSPPPLAGDHPRPHPDRQLAPVPPDRPMGLADRVAGPIRPAVGHPEHKGGRAGVQSVRAGPAGANDFDINLAHLSSPASTTAVTAVPFRGVYITLLQHRWTGHC